MLVFLLSSSLFTDVNATTTKSADSSGYTTDAKGKYPTNSWIPGSQKNVLNYQGDDNKANWDGNPDNTTDSYLDKDSSAIRKYSKETGTPGLYDVYLNVRGKSVTKKTDLVIVADWSGSMNDPLPSDTKTKIARQKEAVEKLTAELQGTEGLNVGFIGYSSDVKKSEMASSWQKSGGAKDKVGSNAKVGLTPATSAKAAIDAEYATLGATPKVIQNGATFTQKAMIEGQAMLDGGSGANKVMVVLTDGIPTFSYHVTGVKDGTSDLMTNGKIASTYKTSPIDGNGDERDTRFDRADRNPDHSYTVNGVKINNHFHALRGTGEDIKNAGTRIVAMGMNIGNGGGVNANNFKSAFQQLASTPSDYHPVNSMGEIDEFINNFAAEITNNTIVNGSITDPIGAQYIFEPNSLSLRSVGKKELTADQLKSITKSYDSATSTIFVDKLNLGADQEVQLHYRVRINTEDRDFNPDTWYQMNGTTTLTPKENNPDKKEEFGVPSGKAPGVKLSVVKKWQTLEGSTLPDKIDFTVSRSTTTSDGTWTSATDSLTKADKWKKNIDHLTVDNKQVSLPKYNNQGKDFVYKVTSENPVLGYTTYISNSNNDWTITNKAQGFQVNKYSADSNQPLAGSKYKLKKYTDSGWQTIDSSFDPQEFVGNTTVKSIVAGYYMIEETEAPKGYQLDTTPVKFQVSKEGKYLDENGHEISKDLPAINGFYIATNKDGIPVLTFAQYDKLKPYGLTVQKVDQDNNKKLAGAKFKLSAKNTEAQTVTTNSDGLAKFRELKPGEYTLEETESPDGYSPYKNKITVTIAADGKVTFSDDSLDGSYHLNSDGNNTISLTVKDHVKGTLPKTGGNGISAYLNIGLSLIVFVAGLVVVEQRYYKREV